MEGVRKPRILPWMTKERIGKSNMGEGYMKDKE